MTKQLQYDDCEESQQQFPPTPPSLFTPLSPGPPLPASLAFEPLPPSSYSHHSKYSTSNHEAHSAGMNSGGGGGGNYYNRGIPTSTRGTTNNHSLSVAHLLNSDDTSPYTSNYYTTSTKESARSSSGKVVGHAGAVGGGNGRDEPIRGYFEGINEPGMGGNDDGNSAIRRTSISIASPPKSVIPVIPINSQLARPRRTISTKQPVIPRQLSPFELSPTSTPSLSLPTQTGGTSTASNRKVSHSLIERRRREKINECLKKLKSVVPQCREEGEKKEARARERGRKRGRGSNAGVEDEGEGGRGGLHKLEILQGTILYIEELESRLAQLTSTTTLDNPSLPSPSSLQSHHEVKFQRQEDSTTTSSPTNSTTSEELILSPPKVRGPPTYRPFTHKDGEAYENAHDFEMLDESLGKQVREDRNAPAGTRAVDVDEEDRAAGLLLLKFSTSPELRPVFFSD